MKGQQPEPGPCSRLGANQLGELGLAVGLWVVGALSEKREQ